jgi:hypothetical protein
MRAAGVLVALVVMMLAGGIANGEHEIIYRYTVLGYVKDAKGRPLSGQVVNLVRDKTGLPYTTDTDADGLYVLVMRLGDESVGETLTLQIGNAQTRVTARFDPKNQVEERGTRVDLEGARWLERASWFRSTLSRMLAPSR